MGDVEIPNFYNINVEVNDYKPKKIEYFVEIAEKQCRHKR